MWMNSDNHLTRRHSKRAFGRRGSALLAVLWISAALAAVGLSLSNTVRGETERVSTDLEGLRAYFLAAGAVEKATVEMLYGRWYPDKPFPRSPGWIDYRFATGVAHVEMIPETAKLDVRDVPPERLLRLLTAMGVDPARVQAITAGIVSRRTGAAFLSPFSSGSTFQAPATSFQEIEELISVPGVTPEILYGSYVPAPDGAREGQPGLVRRSGLVDCLSVNGSHGPVDANTAEPAVLAAVGISPAGIQMLVEARKTRRLEPANLGEVPGGAGNLRFDGGSIYTMRATASAMLANGKLSEVRRTVAAKVKYMPRGYDTWIHILRWYDTTWSEN